MTNRTNDRYQAFADAVTELSEKFGIGIEGGTLYETEAEDHIVRYVCDDSSRLVRR